VADKPDSHEICFVPDGNAGDFVDRQLGSPGSEGEIVDSSGKVVGRHRGLHRYTVGQRKGLGLATGNPMYVLRLDPADDRLVVGTRDDLQRSAFTAADVNWISGLSPVGPIRATVRIRHRHTDAPATVMTDGGTTAAVTFDEPQTAITPGQAAVFYQGDEVLGGGWIR
jgi:tRNA-specific 2-thiouridylase